MASPPNVAQTQTAHPGAHSTMEDQRAELATVLKSELFSRAPTLAHLLSYLCEKTFAGESGQIKEYSIAVDVFGRRESFDQDGDSIVRVQANRLRKRLAEYYALEGGAHRIHISIPVGQYVPVFEEKIESTVMPPTQENRNWRVWLILAVLLVLAAVATIALYMTGRLHRAAPESANRTSANAVEAPVGPPVGDEIRILAGAGKDYTDRAGKTWVADRYFSGGTAVRSSVQYIWRTLDPEIYRNSRQGEFSYTIPLKPGIYELRLHFAETFYGPENPGGGGEGSRVMAVSANGKPLLANFDVAADAEGSRTADVRVFTDISPAQDGRLQLNVSSVHGGRGMLSAIEILPGLKGRIRPVRIVTRDTAYYSNDSHWWSPDAYFKGGQISTRVESLPDTDDPDLYESERWGNFSYAIPVPPGRYTVILHFVERRFGAANRDQYVGPPKFYGGRLFNIFCNGKALLREFEILKEAAENRPLARRFTGLEPNAQGKLLLEFEPVKDYATVTAIEVLPE